MEKQEINLKSSDLHFLPFYIAPGGQKKLPHFYEAPFVLS